MAGAEVVTAVTGAEVAGAEVAVTEVAVTEVTVTELPGAQLVRANSGDVVPIGPIHFGHGFLAH
jgi:hypothetical protein